MTAKAGRITLGLYNCYDAGRWHDIMRRTLARAAPVAAAFDCNLATFGFPFGEGVRRETGQPDAPDPRTPLDVAAFVADSSTIGEGGEHFQELARGGRFSFFPFPKRAGFPPQLGRAVATTPHPDAGRATTPLEVARELAAGRSQLLVFGLGPRGLPRDVMDDARHHLELTGRGISMETATALGALPALLHAHLQHLAPPGRAA
jgi:uncharacterized protein